MKTSTAIAFFLALVLPGIVRADCSSDYTTCNQKQLETPEQCKQTYKLCQQESNSVAGGPAGIGNSGGAGH